MLIKEIHYSEWRHFQNVLGGGPCCNLAFPQGTCYGLYEGGGWAADGRRMAADNEKLAAMVWYTFCFRNNPWRAAAIPKSAKGSTKGRINFLNKNVRLLARISTLPEYRRKGYAETLISNTIKTLNVKYIECLTAHDDIRKLLSKTGFIDFGYRDDARAWYYLRALDDSDVTHDSSRLSIRTSRIIPLP
jgi:hypothetical protein